MYNGSNCPSRVNELFNFTVQSAERDAVNCPLKDDVARRVETSDKSDERGANRSSSSGVQVFSTSEPNVAVVMCRTSDSDDECEVASTGVECRSTSVAIER